jgi:hypothetical protein
LIKLSSSIKLAGIVVATVLLAGGGVALAASVGPAVSSTPASSHSRDADDATSAQGQNGQHGKSGDDCDGKAGASAKPSAHPTVHESEKPDEDSTAGRPSAHPTVRESDEPDVHGSAKPADTDDADEQCGDGQQGEDCDGTMKSSAPHPTATPGKSDEGDETGCQTSPHSTATAHGDTEGAGTGHTGGATTGGEHEASPHPTPTGSSHGDR